MAKVFQLTECIYKVQFCAQELLYKDVLSASSGNRPCLRRWVVAAEANVSSFLFSESINRRDDSSFPRRWTDRVLAWYNTGRID